MSAVLGVWKSSRLTLADGPGRETSLRHASRPRFETLCPDSRNQITYLASHMPGLPNSATLGWPLGWPSTWAGPAQRRRALLRSRTSGFTLARASFVRKGKVRSTRLDCSYAVANLVNSYSSLSIVSSFVSSPVSTCLSDISLRRVNLILTGKTKTNPI